MRPSIILRLSFVLALALLSACSKRDDSHARLASEPAGPSPAAQDPAKEQPVLPPQRSGPGATMGPSGDVDRVIATLRPKFKACYQTALAVNPNAEGSVSLVTRIAADGHVDDVSAPDKSLMSPALVECLSSVVRSATFPAPGGTGSVLRIPVAFNNPAAPAR